MKIILVRKPRPVNVERILRKLANDLAREVDNEILRRCGLKVDAI